MKQTPSSRDSVWRPSAGQSGRGEVLELYDSGRYTLGSRQAVEASFDRAIVQRDPQRFGDACNALFGWAVEFVRRQGLKRDGRGAEEIVRTAWVPVVMSFIARFHDLQQAENVTSSPAALSMKGKQIVDRLVQRLIGFKRNGRRVPGEVTKYLADRRRIAISSGHGRLVTRRGNDGGRDYVGGPADSHPTPADLAEREEDERFLLGRNLEAKLVGVADAEVRQTLQAMVAYVRDYRGRYGGGPIPLFRQKQTPVLLAGGRRRPAASDGAQEF